MKKSLIIIGAGGAGLEALMVARRSPAAEWQVIGFADDILGREGRLVAALRRHYGIQLRQRPEFVGWMRRLARDRELEMAD